MQKIQDSVLDFLPYIYKTNTDREVVENGWLDREIQCEMKDIVFG